ncbi:MAG: glycosyltransferase [Ornithinimicrobium sp.]|uniref:glycosyltransferase n=1 Tax=Ornithinimicrobium sp. TaxID=1977084 RepID=UPI003D9B07B1
MIAPIEQVLVVVPARDEQELIGGCLDSISDAAARLAASPRPCLCLVVVVLDGCTDRTAEVVATRPWAQAVAVDLGRVGAVRRRGVDTGLSLLPSSPTGPASGAGAERVWLAHTDADSRVPPEWLTRQLTVADTGVDLVLGSVEPDPGDLTQRLQERWHAEHGLREGHLAVHGANLGVRGSAYERAGGFASLAVHEDVDLASRVRRTGGRCLSTDLTRVRTSGRASSRVVGGFADYLDALARAELEPGA